MSPRSRPRNIKRICSWFRSNIWAKSHSCAVSNRNISIDWFALGALLSAAVISTPKWKLLSSNVSGARLKCRSTSSMPRSRNPRLVPTASKKTPSKLSISTAISPISSMSSCSNFQNTSRKARHPPPWTSSAMTITSMACDLEIGSKS